MFKQCAHGLFAVVITGIAGCATHPDKMQAAYVSPMEYQGYNCEQIGMEMRYVSRRANELYGTLDKEAGNDSAQMALGLILFWPSLFFLEGGDDARASEYARLKGQRDALEKAAIRKECDPASLPRFEVPRPAEPEAPRHESTVLQGNRRRGSGFIPVNLRYDVYVVTHKMSHRPL